MTARRLGVWALVMFWQGGFMFYGAVVVPVGAAALGSDTAQGFVTRRVTLYLNLAGIAALTAWGWDILADPARERRIRGGLWAFLAATLAVQFWLHPRLDALLDPAAGRVLDQARFRELHQVYLIVSTIQWAAGLALAAATIRTWGTPVSR